MGKGAVHYLPKNVEYAPMVKTQNVFLNQIVQEPRRGDVDTASVCPPVTNIVFIKVHKAGSTTIASMFLRYGYKNRLSVAIPSGGDKVWLGWPGPISRNALIAAPSPGGQNVNILAHHSVYNEQRMKSIMAPNSEYIAILREPYKHFLSSFRYMNVDRFLKITKSDPVAEFLKSPEHYEKPYYGFGKPISLTRNIMSYDMGLPASTYGRPDIISEYIRYIDSQFRLVLILEYIEESMILLKRYLCWKLSDVIFLKVLPSDDPSGKAHITKDSPILRNQLYKWSTADFMMYDYFNRTLWNTIAQQPDDYFEEVEHFRKVLLALADYCRGVRPYGAPLVIPQSAWDGEVRVGYTACQNLKLNDLNYSDMFRRRYRDMMAPMVRRP